MCAAKHRIHKLFNICEQKILAYSIGNSKKNNQRTTIRTIKGNILKHAEARELESERVIFESSRKHTMKFVFVLRFDQLRNSVDNCVFLFHLNLIEIFFEKKAPLTHKQTFDSLLVSL